jgi:hypothetical protein
VAAFKVRLSPASGPEISAQIRSSPGGENRYATALQPGAWTSRIIPVNHAGKDGTVTELVFEWPPKIKKENIDLNLDKVPENARVDGKIDFGPGGAVFAGGWLELPHQDWMNLSSHSSLSFEFKADDVEGMPVLLSHGLWQTDGWFAQILGGRLVIRTPRADANGPAIEKGKWYNIRWEIDGSEHRLLVNGKEVQPFGPAVLEPASRAMHIGQYDRVEPQYQFRGTIRNIQFETREVQVTIESKSSNRIGE